MTMLIPNKIPDIEPILRVGIILPEDKKQTIRLEIPREAAYQLISADGLSRFSLTGTLQFKRDDDDLISTNYGKSTSWTVKPRTVEIIKPRSGAKVFDVAAGRGFHWQKPIDIYLSGAFDIRVYQKQLILINELPLEAYLMCVATSEMAAACPPALLESQTITARSWMLANIEQKHIAMGMDVCNDDCCQRYQGNGNLTGHSIRGAANTTGKVLLYDETICDARYSKSCGGMMESFATIWPGDDLPYLKNIPDAPTGFNHAALPLSTEEKIQQWIDDIPDTFCSPHAIAESELKKYLGSVDEAGSYFRWHFSYTQEALTSLLNKKLGLKIKKVIRLQPINRGGSGRISKLEIIYTTTQGEKKSHFIDSEYRIRQALHPGFLYSSCFYIRTGPGQFELIGAGWGHGAGYCQIGALGMALANYSTEEILAHYYPGTNIKKIY